jgi:hypothetical protein
VDIEDAMFVGYLHSVVLRLRAAIWRDAVCMFQTLNGGCLCRRHSYVGCFDFLNKHNISLVYLSLSLFLVFVMPTVPVMVPYVWPALRM